MHCNITLPRLLTLLRNELKEDYEAFENAVATKLFTLQNVFSNTPIKQKDKADAIIYAIGLFDTKVSETMKLLLSWSINSDSYSQRKHKTTKLSQDTRTPASPDKTKPKSSPRDVPSSSSDTTLSRKKTKQLTKWMSERVKSDNIYSCKIANCKICERIFSECAITKCNHTKPHNDVGYFPHLNRRLVRKIHATNEFAILPAIKGIANPLRKRDEQTTTESTTSMEVTSTPAVISKKRKVSDDDAIWATVMSKIPQQGFVNANARMYFLEWLKKTYPHCPSDIWNKVATWQIRS